MKAMVLAAGLGARLRPLTKNRPKALVEIGGRTLLEITLSRLRAFGVSEVIVNVHHFADMIIEELKTKKNCGMRRVEISREEELLDTGGGLKKASWFFLEDGSGSVEPFILHNVDVISTIDLRQMMEGHRQARAVATLAVQERDSSRYLIFDEMLWLCGRKAGRDSAPEIVRESGKMQGLAFSGIHVISPRIFSMMKEEGAAFSIIDTYLRSAARGEKIIGFRADGDYWRDLGKLEQVRQAERDFQQKIFV